jgi:hypothetical protein
MAVATMAMRLTDVPDLIPGWLNLPNSAATRLCSTASTLRSAYEDILNFARPKVRTPEEWRLDVHGRLDKVVQMSRPPAGVR